VIPDKAPLFGMFPPISSRYIFTFFTAKTQSAQRKDNFLLPLRGRQKKKLNRYMMIFWSKCPQGLLLIVFRALNGKQ
jgi:hypothetical protein